MRTTTAPACIPKSIQRNIPTTVAGGSILAWATTLSSRYLCPRCYSSLEALCTTKPATWFVLRPISPFGTQHRIRYLSLYMSMARISFSKARLSTKPYALFLLPLEYHPLYIHSTSEINSEATFRLETVSRAPLLPCQVRARLYSLDSLRPQLATASYRSCHQLIFTASQEY